MGKSEFNLYYRNYGIINKVEISESNDLTISVTNHGIYDKLFLNNREFLSMSILPVEMLRIIFNKYMSFTHNEVQNFTISQPTMCPNSQEPMKFDWICHRLAQPNHK